MGEQPVVMFVHDDTQPWCGWCADPAHVAASQDHSALTDCHLIHQPGMPHALVYVKGDLIHLHGATIAPHAALTIRSILTRRVQHARRQAGRWADTNRDPLAAAGVTMAAALLYRKATA